MITKENVVKTQGEPVILKENVVKTQGHPVISKENIVKSQGHPVSLQHRREFCASQRRSGTYLTPEDVPHTSTEQAAVSDSRN